LGKHGVFPCPIDLHLELFPGFRLDPARVAAPYLILAGALLVIQTEEYCLFLQHCATLFDGVFMVLGEAAQNAQRHRQLLSRRRQRIHKHPKSDN
jgi:hypothetical protein